MRVNPADLGHNQLTVRSDICPIGLAKCVVHARPYLRPARALKEWTA